MGLQYNVLLQLRFIFLAVIPQTRLVNKKADDLLQLKVYFLVAIPKSCLVNKNTSCLKMSGALFSKSFQIDVFGKKKN